MSAVWKIVRVFISSTFRDMQAERDWLVKRVFPALRQRLEPHRLNLVDIDLRWGITREQADNDQVLGLCLQQIDECRPFFVGLLGGRYGWVPGEDRIKAAAREAGFGPEDERASVTALEIEYGLLKKDPVQRRRPQEVGALCSAPQRRASLRGMVRLDRHSHACRGQV